ncbi:hypothetical protein [Methylobacter sp. YRD-M1]|uniref:hypothetical protein n=1 Tax=Methylobacter sp. YRD-M1 TaxID=2911520 RepID=UPI00227CDE0F|nr:hypothetical protein [Methylobacter sp. YRD-M1]WAK01841.1 hypothetical protein LZ558_18810 [Methylobacter sp. YRD-M1]
MSVYLDVQLPEDELMAILPELNGDYCLELIENSSLEDKQWYNDLRLNVFKAVMEGKVKLDINLARFMFRRLNPNDTPEDIEVAKDYHIRYGSAKRYLLCQA